MSMECAVFAVIPVELTREVIEKIILNGEGLEFYYDNLDIHGKEKFKEGDISSLIDHLYLESKAISAKTYNAWVDGYADKSGYFLGLTRGGETHFPLKPNEFELRFTCGNALYKHAFFHENFYTDLSWYTQTVLDLTKGLPIKKLHTLLK